MEFNEEYGDKLKDKKIDYNKVVNNLVAEAAYINATNEAIIEILNENGISTKSLDEKIQKYLPEKTEQMLDNLKNCFG